MKKIIIFLLIVLCPIISLAKEYEKSDINMKLNIKDDFIVLTRDNLEGNTNLDKLNISKKTMEELMNKNNIYFDIISSDISYEILIVVPNVVLDFHNLNNANDDILNELRAELVKKTGATVSDIYKGNHNYIVIDYYDKNTKYYIVNYYTVVNAKGYNIQLQKKSAITNEEKSDLREIVDSITIETLEEYKNENSETQSKIDNYNKNKKFNWMNVLYGALIGAIAGLIAYGISYIIRKKKSSI